MDTFLEKYNLPKLNEEEAENLNGSFSIKFIVVTLVNKIIQVSSVHFYNT